ncbi:MAG: twin-arginine translocation signal domain-containing protein [Planctomycetota bacterium]
MMDNKKVTRRKFMRDSALTAASVAVGLGAVTSQSTKAAGSAAVDTSKILNYNLGCLLRRAFAEQRGTADQNSQPLHRRRHQLHRCMHKG